MGKIDFNIALNPEFSEDSLLDGDTAVNALARQVGNKPCVVRTNVVCEMFRCSTESARSIIIGAMKKNGNIIFVP